MPDDEFAEGIISLDTLKELAELFDTFEHAFCPTSISAKEAEFVFDVRIRKIFEEQVKVVTAYSSVSFDLFRLKLRTLCRRFLNKNP